MDRLVTSRMWRHISADFQTFQIQANGIVWWQFSEVLLMYMQVRCLSFIIILVYNYAFANMEYIETLLIDILSSVDL